MRGYPRRTLRVTPQMVEEGLVLSEPSSTANIRDTEMGTVEVGSSELQEGRMGYSGSNSSRGFSWRKSRLCKLIQRVFFKRRRGNARRTSADETLRLPATANLPENTEGDQRAGVDGNDHDKETQTERPSNMEQEQRDEIPQNKLPQGPSTCPPTGSDVVKGITGSGHPLPGSPQHLGQPGEGPAVKYLRYFLAFLYFICMSPIKPESAIVLPKMVYWIQAAFFWTCSVMSVIDAFVELKDGYLQFSLEEDMFNFICFGFYFANCLTRIYYIWLLTTSFKPTNELLDNIDNVSAKGPAKSGGWPLILAIGIGTFSVFLATLTTIFGGAALSSWTLEKTTLAKSSDISEFLFVWTTTNWKNVTTHLWEKYGTELTATTQMLATVGNALNYCGTLHACVLLDLWFMVSVQIYMLEVHFSRTFDATQSQNPLSIHWQEYLRLRGVCDQSDNIFGKLLKFVHIQNLLQFCYFLLEMLKKGNLNIYPFIDFISVIKICITYYLAQKTASKNEKYEESVVRSSECRPNIFMDGEEKSVMVLLTDMKSHPIGVGRGEFFVNEAFVLKFVGFVGSIFVLLSGESDDLKCSCICSQN